MHRTNPQCKQHCYDIHPANYFPNNLHATSHLATLLAPSGGCEARRVFFLTEKPGDGKAVKIRRGRAAVKDVAHISKTTAGPSLAGR
ncbi:MAG: hypothetical protein JWL69_2994 [Phycisphaerales bacterium]|nr:hypothetical protein [Phycisphaerales bacterium]